MKSLPSQCLCYNDIAITAVLSTIFLLLDTPEINNQLKNIINSELLLLLQHTP